MTTHAQHPRIPEAGLSANCPRCLEMAAAPFQTLDDDNLRQLVERTKRWMRDEQYPRSEAEMSAMRIVETAIVQARHLQRLGVALVVEPDEAA